MTTLSPDSAIVTGAGRGFGRAIALALADAGATVTLTSRTDAEIRAVTESIRQRGGRAQAITGDVCDLSAVRCVYDAHRAAFGPATILVNCAGTAEPVGPIGQVDVQHWWHTMTVNVLGPLNYMSAALPAMQAAGRGCIINVSSLGAKFVASYDSAYCVSKATLARLTEHVAQENADSGVAVFAVHPGTVYTALTEQCVQSADARRWIPQFVAHLEGLKKNDGQVQLTRCGRHCVALASGRHNDLSGKFLDLAKPELAGSSSI
jgi:NAD(P)-dependent dehydrogenase (short-subunit alcohol dehydrogenase family)